MTARTGALALILFACAASVGWAQPRSDAAARHTAARPVLNEVLAQPAFARASRRSWQTRLQEHIRAWLQDVAARLLAPVLGRRSVAQVFAWIASIAALLVLAAWLLRIASRRTRERPIGLGTPAPAAASGYILGAEAAALIRAGRIRDGARAAYRAAIRRLEEDGAFAADPARTPRESLRLLVPTHRRAAALAAMTAAFETICYGARPAGADEGARLLRLLGELECLPSERAK